ncbi:MAG: cell division protein FtsZ [Fimbriimonadaceae bacterium]|nr:cell division protein FtsZ [Fimbriimonadaceae bacterium]
MDAQDQAEMNPVNLFETVAVIKVIGVGGAGCNAVNRMVDAGVEGVEFIAMNTDKQALDASKAQRRLSLGTGLTRGLGTGGDPDRGAAAAKESEKAIMEAVDGADMVFVTAGLGGGTGTGAAPVVCECARRAGALTVAVVTKPFLFEGPRRKRQADAGLERLRQHVDTVITIPNDKLTDVVERKASLQDAFLTADDVLRQGVQGISDIILRPGLINVDFADVSAVMKDAGIALMGMGRGSGERRARAAAEAAVNSPMLETTIVGAKKILVNITAGLDFSLSEVQEAMEYVMQLADPEEANVFLGHVVDESLGDDVVVTLLAADLPSNPLPVDRQVFTYTGEVRRRSEEPAPEDVPATTRVTQKPIEIEDIDLDIPAFLRRQRQGG